MTLFWLGAIAGSLVTTIIIIFYVASHYAGEMKSVSDQDGWTKIRLVVSDPNLIERRWVWFKRSAQKSDPSMDDKSRKEVST